MAENLKNRVEIELEIKSDDTRIMHLPPFAKYAMANAYLVRTPARNWE